MSDEKKMILALDLASRVGFAFGRAGDRKPKSGSINLGSGEAPRPRRYRRYREWLTELVNTIDADVVCYERPFAGENIQTARFLFGLSEHTEEMFENTGISLHEASVAEVRKHFIGSAPRGDEGKKLTMRKCTDLGWEFEDNDAADAMAVWSYQRSFIVPRLAVSSTPLFSAVPGRDRLER